MENLSWSIISQRTFRHWCQPHRWLIVMAACITTGHNMVHSHSESVCLVDCGSAAKRTCIAGPCEGTVDDSASNGLRQLAIISQSMTFADDLSATYSASVTLACKLAYSKVQVDQIQAWWQIIWLQRSC
ncbi:TPA: hypothetical protein ACH3X1_007838 [Trebouxia sp. C0004]